MTSSVGEKGLVHCLCAACAETPRKRVVIIAFHTSRRPATAHQRLPVLRKHWVVIAGRERREFARTKGMRTYEGTPSPRRTNLVSPEGGIDHRALLLTVRTHALLSTRAHTVLTTRSAYSRLLRKGFGKRNRSNCEG